MFLLFNQHQLLPENLYWFYMWVCEICNDVPNSCNVPGCLRFGETLYDKICEVMKFVPPGLTFVLRQNALNQNKGQGIFVVYFFKLSLTNIHHRTDSCICEND